MLFRRDPNEIRGRSKRQIVLSTKINQDLLSINTLALRRCGESVIGPWAKSTVRRFRTRDFRFEVLFETPILFTSSPSSRSGPLKNRDVHYIDGSPSSHAETSVEIPSESHNYASDERASWYILLCTLQTVECTSRQWDESSRISSDRDLERPTYGLAVGIQRKTQSWDFMPSAVQKASLLLLFLCPDINVDSSPMPSLQFATLLKLLPCWEWW